MIRTLDATPFNAIFRHPEVRPWMGFGLAEADLTPIVSDPRNYCLLTADGEGGYILVRLDQGLYAAHTLSLPSARGRGMFRLMQEGFAHMFTATDAVEIVTMVPDGNERGDKWAQLAGFRETFRREACFQLIDRMVGGSFRSLAYGDWVLRDRDNGREGGEFHDRLEAKLPHENHTEDRVHDSWVGATLRGCQAGNAAKSVALYNRWAVQAGYLPVRILSLTPPLVDIGTAVIGLNTQGLDILKPS